MTQPLIDKAGRYLTEPEEGTEVWVLLSSDYFGQLHNDTPVFERGNVFVDEASAQRADQRRLDAQTIRRLVAEHGVELQNAASLYNLAINVACHPGSNCGRAIAAAIPEDRLHDLFEHGL